MLYYSLGNCLDAFLKNIFEFYEIMDSDQQIILEFLKKYENIRSNDIFVVMSKEEKSYILDLMNRMVLIKKENYLVCHLDKFKKQVVAKCIKENSLIPFFIFIKNFSLSFNKNSYVAHSIVLDL